MKNLLQLIIENLVENKEAVLIEEVKEEKALIYRVKVAESDIGKVIGKEGRIAKSIRTIIKSIAKKENKTVVVEFID